LEWYIVSGSPDPEIPEVSVTETWATLQKQSAAVLVDVRTQAEWTYVGVPDLSSLGRKPLLVEWQSFPTNTVDPHFSDRLAKAVVDGGGGLETEIFFLCRSGVRSLAAARAMAAAGYKRCRNITGGFEGGLNAERHRGQVAGWKAAHLPWTQG
jgi:rhodanese-related sulfurtransferase